MRILFQILKELLFVITYPFGFIVSFFLIHDAHTTTTILIVETWFTKNIHHKKWETLLKRRGFDVHIVNFPIYKGTFEESAKKLKEYIDENEFSNIVLVGLSSGGITSLLYLEDFDGWGKVKKFISISTPFYGSPMAFFTLLTKSGQELLPTSKFVQEMKERKVKNLDKIVCIQAKYDEMVPEKSAALKGARTITLDVIGHNNLHLDTEEAYEIVASIARES